MLQIRHDVAHHIVVAHAVATDHEPGLRIERFPLADILADIFDQLVLALVAQQRALGAAMLQTCLLYTSPSPRDCS